MKLIQRHGHLLLTLFIGFVFIQSLFFKFTDSPETQYIFVTKLDAWAATLGFAGVFAPGGIFSAKVVGSAELAASVLLLAGALVPAWRALQVLGAALGLGVISGAIMYHLFTPLGVAVRNNDGTSDGGQLFMLACGVWLSCAVLLFMRRSMWMGWIGRRAG
jgi:hypothetical protein